MWYTNGWEHFDSSLFTYIHSIVGLGDYGMKINDKLRVEYHLCAWYEGNFFKTHNNAEAILFRMDSHTTIKDASVIRYDKNGNIALIYPFDAIPLFDSFSYGVAFFGGHLPSRDKSKPVMIVQEEVDALLGYIAFPQYWWLAVGAGQIMTKDLLSTISCGKLFLLPENAEKAECWKELSPHAKILETFIHTNLRSYLETAIKSKLK